MGHSRVGFVVSTFIGFAAGCAAPPSAYWTKPGAAQGELNRDRIECVALAYQKYPSLPVPAAPSQTPNGYGKTCTGDARFIHCDSQSSGAITSFDPFGTRERAEAADQIKQARAYEAIGCMQSRGWSITRGP